MRQRLLSFLMFVLPAPFGALLASRAGDRVTHHYCQAMGVTALGLLLFFGAIIDFSLLSWVITWESGIAQRWHLETIMNWIVMILGGLWALLYLAGVICALADATLRLPLASDIGNNKKWRRITVAVETGLLVVAALIIWIAVDSLKQARDFDERPAQVYVLYDDMGFVPRGVLTLGSYRLAQAANARWGEGSTVVARLNTARLKHALANGKLVYLATHGGSEYGGILYGERELYPKNMEDANLHPGPNLQYVYLSACYGGALEQEWQQAFSPAEVITFNRVSAVLEHAWWFWTKAPDVVAGLE